jgi:hypothetical protein
MYLRVKGGMHLGVALIGMLVVLPLFHFDDTLLK